MNHGDITVDEHGAIRLYILEGSRIKCLLLRYITSEKQERLEAREQASKVLPREKLSGNLINIIKEVHEL